MTDASTQTRSVVVERDFAHAPGKLWRALTQPHLIEAWLMKNDFAPQVGHHFQLRGDWGGVLDCEVVTLEPERELAYTWNYNNPDPSFHTQTVVTFTLTPTDDGTHLRVEQSGFGKDQKQALGGALHGWTAFLGKLDEVVAREA